MLRITIHDSVRGTTFKLDGKLAGPWVQELEQCWLTASSASQGRAVIVDMAQVTFIDPDGKLLLERMHERGVELLATAPLNRAIVDEIARNRKTLAVVLFVLTFLGAGALHAEDSGPLQLSLQEAVRIALRQNPQVRIGNLTAEQSRQDARVARAELLPQVGLQAYEREQRFNVEALFGSSFPGVP